MSETSFLKNRWKLILNIVTLLALLALIWALRHQLTDTLSNLARVHASVLLLLLPLQWFNYHAQTKMYQGMFAMLGNKLKYKFLFRTALELNFVNQVFPSGGAAGISYFGVRMRNGEITGGRATLIQIMKLGLLFLSFEILLLVGLFLLALGNQANDVVILVTSSISTLMVVGTLGFMSILGSKKRIHNTFVYTARGLNKMINWVRPKSPETINIGRFETSILELHNNYLTIKSRYRELRGPFLWALLVNLSEVLKIYVVYLAFGEWVNIGAIILAYSVANFAGLVSVMPGGIGIYEALMTGVLAAAGVPARLSIPVTVMYRVLSTIIQLPIGYYFYNKTLRSRQDEAAKRKEMHDD